MDNETTRRDFIRGSTLAATGLLAVASSGHAQGDKPPHEAQQRHHQEHQHQHGKEFPRDHAGPGGPVGSPNDRGKLVPGARSPSEPPVLVETPDLPNNLPWNMVKGAKEFHLHAQSVKRELLPGNFMNHWGYNGSMPGPTIQVTEGNRVRIVLHNELPEPTTLHRSMSARKWNSSGRNESKTLSRRLFPGSSSMPSFPSSSAGLRAHPRRHNRNGHVPLWALHFRAMI